MDAVIIAAGLAGSALLYWWLTKRHPKPSPPDSTDGTPDESSDESSPGESGDESSSGESSGESSSRESGNESSSGESGDESSSGESAQGSDSIAETPNSPGGGGNGASSSMANAPPPTLDNQTGEKSQPSEESGESIVVTDNPTEPEAASATPPQRAEDKALANKSSEEMDQALKSLDLNKLLQDAGLKQGAYYKQELAGVDFPLMTHIIKSEVNQTVLTRLKQQVNSYAMQLKKYFEQCGLTNAVKEDCLIGPTIQPNVYEAQWGNLRIFEDKRSIPHPSVDIQMIYDCSGSQVGNGIDLTRAFGVLVNLAVTNVRGITGHNWGFSSNTLIDCGKLGEQRVTGLSASGGTNEAGALFHAYTNARRSNKKLRLLIMISDGQPDNWNALHKLVQRLEREGYIPIQIAIGSIPTPAYSKRYFVDLTGLGMHRAVQKLGALLVSLVQLLQK